MSWEPVVTDITRMLMETVKVHQPLPDFTSNNPLFGEEISSCQSFFMFRILVILLRYILFKIFTYKL